MWDRKRRVAVDVHVMPFAIPTCAYAIPLDSKWVASEFKIDTTGAAQLAFLSSAHSTDNPPTRGNLKMHEIRPAKALI